MNYKTVTVIEKVEVDGRVYENTMKDLTKYLKEGYRIINVSSSHVIRPNTSQSDLKIKPTSLELVSTYLLVLE